MELNDKKKRIAILIVTLVLAVIFIVLAIVCKANERSPYDYDSGSSSTSGSIHIGGNSKYINSSRDVTYSFTPSSGGYYTFYSLSETSSTDPSAELKSSSGGTLYSDDDSNGNRDFRIRAYLYAGTTYYLTVSVRSSGNVAIYVTKS